MDASNALSFPALDWWWLPLSGRSEHALPPAVYWHARLMVLAWGLWLPCGVLVARFFKIWPGQDWPRELDRRHWWRLHLWGQGAAMVLALLALALMLWAGPDARPATGLATAHTRLGWCVLGLGVLQVLGGRLRGSKGGPTDRQMRGDHFDMTHRRIWFERLHKSLGWVAIGLAQGAIALGLIVADAPRWMLAAMLLWWLALLMLFMRWQWQGRCVDTYQAIWGSQTHLPGLQKPPIGWGVRRLPHGR